LNLGSTGRPGARADPMITVVLLDDQLLVRAGVRALLARPARAQRLNR
jgi:hypothetical protein